MGRRVNFLGVSWDNTCALRGVGGNLPSTRAGLSPLHFLDTSMVKDEILVLQEKFTRYGAFVLGKTFPPHIRATSA